MNTFMEQMGKAPSKIREIFEYANKRRAEIGAENVFDFSLGNPNVPVPDSVKETYRELLETKDDLFLHGYTSGPGAPATRQAIAGALRLPADLGGVGIAVFVFGYFIKSLKSVKILYHGILGGRIIITVYRAYCLIFAGSYKLIHHRIFHITF